MIRGTVVDRPYMQRPRVWIHLFLVLVPLATYWSVLSAEFINLDDHIFIYENPHVVSGIRAENVVWAFAHSQQGNWSPLTSISHMIDCQLFGLNAGFHHLSNLLLHILSSSLLFAVFYRMTARPWASAFVAALFALHPLHVESVAWVSERKDVLSTFFWMLTIWGYLRHVERPGTTRYLWVLVPFGLGLMAKPMLVTLPFVLLLLDYWPLERIGPGRFDRNVLYEKLPLFGLAAACSAVTVLAQRGAGNVQSLTRFSIDERIANAVVAYAQYTAKMFWPTGLAVYYPHPGSYPSWEIFASAIFLAVVTILATLAISRAPYLLVGWLWFLGTLVPVIGLIQVGTQAMADRYTYVPSIGLLIIVAWGAPQLLARWRHCRTALVVTSGIVLALVVPATWRQAGYWADSITLFERSLEMTEPSVLANMTLGLAHATRGNLGEAERNFAEVLKIDAGHATAHHELGAIAHSREEQSAAMVHYRAALESDPDHARSHHNLGALLLGAGAIDEAIHHFERALRIMPDSEKTRTALGQARSLRDQDAPAPTPTRSRLQ